MKTDDLREAYLAFFESKGCVRRPSDVLVPRDDPTVLFTPAGMNQFKNQFLGIGPLEFTKATTCQKCIRTGDIDNVGVTAYHHTFFEMLGNFSFGDYFKREAINWAWEFLTAKAWLGLDPERLTVTVYLDDDEAAGIWQKDVGLSTDRISRCDQYENFWPAGAPTNGPDGVCGPCSEIYYLPPGGSKPVEIWNLVFTQFNRVGEPPDNLRPLPKKNIDTGMGLERCASVLQGVLSNFEIDILRPLCVAAGDAVGRSYAFDAPEGRALRRIADHIRCVTMCAHEGVVPDNAKQGYVVRQLLRRAMLEGFLLGRQEPFLHTLVPIVAELMQRPYPDVLKSVAVVASIVREEETQFLGTIERGLSKWESVVEKARSGGGVVSGEEAFGLHSQDGFLIDLTVQMAARNGLTVDRDRFDALVKEHEERSGSGAFLNSVMAEGPLDAIRKQHGGTKFIGYDQVQAAGKVVGIIAHKQLAKEHSGGETIGVLLDQTPFYGEAGGQVGDTGILKGQTFEFQVTDTQRNADLFIHIGRLKQGTIHVGDEADARIDAERRAGIRRAHSATHLLHHALRQTLGPNAMQRGSKVENDILRFDFAHAKPVTADELRRIEDEINLRVSEGAAVVTEVTDQKVARERGAMMLFGEKYPDRVRMVTMGDFSVELCGGTHLANTGQVGLCRLVSEEPVAKGVRRVTCVTGQRAIQQVREAERLLREAATLLRAPMPAEIPEKIAALQDELQAARRELAEFTKASIADEAAAMLREAEVVGGVKLIVRELKGVPRDSLKEMVDLLRAGKEPAAVLLGLVDDGKVALIAAVSKELAGKKLHAGECVKAAAKVVGGGGGGRPDLAEAGGKDPSRLAEALEAGQQVFRAKLA
ncbi:MAG: alanine--tRNA ligase [Planctomyces sp.]|nr:alanine--tRNA ligase [Planctomyces sp.]